jgi:hypothetical protein
MNQTCLIDLHRKKGKRPEYDLYIGRSTYQTEFTEDSIWHNPYRMKSFKDPQDCLLRYKERILYLIMMDPVKYNLKTLIGKRMGCWCCTTDSIKPPLRCHGQVLLQLLWQFFPEEMKAEERLNLNKITSYKL